MVEHDAARADPHLLGLRRDAGDQHFWAGAGKGLRVVVFGQPIAVIPQRFAGLGERNRLRHGLGGGAVSYKWVIGRGPIAACDKL